MTSFVENISNQTSNQNWHLIWAAEKDKQNKQQKKTNIQENVIEHMSKNCF